jgi:SAM-dependent MidA family methyltransferase
MKQRQPVSLFLSVPAVVNAVCLHLTCSDLAPLKTMIVPGREQSSTEPLAERLRQRIRREGTINFRDWMAAALYDPREGYYCRRDLTRWGRAGDYRTSPERSPLFAATFARYFASLHQELDSPHAWTILEAGAGAGHFASGVLETLQRFYPHVFAATSFLIDEASADARQRAEDRLETVGQRVESARMREIETEISTGIIFSNELLDAFPVHRVVMREGHLLELCVGLEKTERFIWVEREPTTPRLAAYFKGAGVNLAEGQIAEINLEAEEWMARAAAILKRGYIITVDYGAEADELYRAPRRRQGTLRAIRQHRLADDVLSRPGELDLTTTIDWTHIRRIGEEHGLQTISFEPQDKFLLRAGLLDQLEMMAAVTQSEADALALRTSVRELILPGGAGESFQVLVQKSSDGGRA